MRPIDADGLKEELEKYKNEMFELANESKGRYNRNISLGKYYTIVNVMEIIKEKETIKAEPVVHGEWLKCYREEHKRCSNCDVIAFIGLYPNGNANYCPNCGSKNSEVE